VTDEADPKNRVDPSAESVGDEIIHVFEAFKSKAHFSSPVAALIACILSTFPTNTVFPSAEDASELEKSKKHRFVPQSKAHFFVPLFALTAYRPPGVYIL